MKLSAPYTRTWAGFGLAAALLMGCQSLEQGTDPSQDQALAPNEAPEDLALRLSIKQTDSCKALKESLYLGYKTGTVDSAGLALFLGTCIEEGKGSGFGRHGDLPRDLRPDSVTRCHWIGHEIGRGRPGMGMKFRYYCPDDCDSLAVADSAKSARYCRDPQPIIPCDSLATALEGMNPRSEESPRLGRFLRSTCKDSAYHPRVNPCDSLVTRLKGLDTASSEYAGLAKEIRGKCGFRPDFAKPDHVPGDTLRRAHCDSLKAGIAAATGTARDTLIPGFRAECGEGRFAPGKDFPRPASPSCDSLKAALAAQDSTSRAHDALLHVVREHCEAAN